MLPPEVIPAAVSMLSSILSISASTKKLMESSRLSSKAALEEFERNAPAATRQILNNEDAKSSILDILDSLVISGRLLSQLSDEAQDCENIHIKDRQAASSDAAKNQANIKAAQCMCNVLRDIKRYNKGSLPANSPLFENWWASYGCSD